MSLLHVGHEVTGGRLEAGLLLALTFGVIWLHVMLLGLFNSGDKPKGPNLSSRRRAVMRRRRRERGPVRAAPQYLPVHKWSRCVTDWTLDR